MSFSCGRYGDGWRSAFASFRRPPRDASTRRSTQKPPAYRYDQPIAPAPRKGHPPPPPRHIPPGDRPLGWSACRSRLTRLRETLVSCPWSGNIRDLRNAIERSVIFCEGELITWNGTVRFGVSVTLTSGRVHQKWPASDRPFRLAFAILPALLAGSFSLLSGEEMTAQKPSICAPGGCLADQSFHFTQSAYAVAFGPVNRAMVTRLSAMTPNPTQRCMPSRPR
jgi:hypothetical protein